MPANSRREARRKAGFRTQQDLADWLGLHKSTVANYESSKVPLEPKPWYDDYIRLLGKERELEQVG